MRTGAKVFVASKDGQKLSGVLHDISHDSGLAEVVLDDGRAVRVELARVTEQPAPDASGNRIETWARI